MRKHEILIVMILLFSINISFLQTVTADETISLEIDLVTGFNGISIPIQNSWKASTLAENISGCISINKWNPITQSNWPYYVGGPMSFDFEIEDGQGLLIELDSDSTFSMSGIQLEDVYTDLYQNLNLLGWYKQESTTASNIFNSIGGCSQVHIFDEINQKYIYYNSSSDDDFTISQGMSYYLVIDTLDTNLPITSESLSGTYEDGVYTSDVTVSLSASDENSAIQVTKYKLEGGDWQTYSSPFSFDDNGEYIFYYYSVDYSNNIEATKSASFTIDKQPVEKNLEIIAPSSINEEENIQITLNSEDEPISGVVVDIFDEIHTTDSNGIVNVVAPSVDSDRTYPITASKTGYIADSTNILIINVPEPIPSINLLSPNGGETWSGSQYIIWNIINQDSHLLSITIQYNINNGVWNTLFEDYDNIDGSYILDTTTLENSEYFKIRLILKQDTNDDGEYDTIISSDTSDDFFTINNEIIKSGWFYGTVYAQSNEEITPLDDAMVCVIISDIDDIITNKCTFTDENGYYLINLDAGNYTAQALKQGYQTSTKNDVKIIADSGKNVDFALQKTAQTQTKTITDYTIKNEIKTGKITAQIDKTNGDTDVMIYDDSINLQINQMPPVKNQILSCTISADEETPGTKIVIYLGEIKPEHIKIQYDEEIITETQDIETFFQENNTKTEYVLLNSDGQTIAVVNIPEFSEHTINILSIPTSIKQISRYTYHMIVVAIIIIAAAAIFMMRKSND